MKIHDKLQQDVIAQPQRIDVHPGADEKKIVKKASSVNDFLVDFTFNDQPKRNGWDTLRHRWQRLSGGAVLQRDL